MTTPNVTEMPRSVIRELDHRHNDGIDVLLLWNQTDDRVTVAVSDAKTGEAFEIAVDGRDALDAFHHPYAYVTAADAIPRAA
jgi:hypothetical protein